MRPWLFSICIGLSCAVGHPVESHPEESVCADAAVLFCDDFETGTLERWQDGYQPTLHAVTSEAAHVYAGRWALEVTYPEGGEGKWLARWFMPGVDRAFARLYVKFQEGYRCGVNCTKLMAFYGNRVDDRFSGFGKAGIRPNGTDFFYAALVTLKRPSLPDPGEIIFYSYFPEMKIAPDGHFWGNATYQSEPREPLTPGRWTCLELEVQANQPGLRDGYERMWINDQFKGQSTGMRWRDTDDVRINAFQLTFSASPAPITERIWVDNVVISTERIGCRTPS